MALGKSYGFEKLDPRPELLDRVRDDWRALRPLVEWVRERGRRPRLSGGYSGLRRVAIVRSTSQWAAIETSLPSSLTR